MRKDKIRITFNKDSMTVSDLKKAVYTLDHILADYDKFSDNPEEFLLRVMQIRDSYINSIEG